MRRIEIEKIIKYLQARYAEPVMMLDDENRIVIQHEEDQGVWYDHPNDQFETKYFWDDRFDVSKWSDEQRKKFVKAVNAALGNGMEKVLYWWYGSLVEY